MRGLKALVIGMGVLIVAGLAALLVAIADRAGDLTAADAGFGVVRVPIPAGATVVASTAGDGRLVVRLRLADGTPRIVLIDLANGRRLGAIDLPAAAP